MATGEAESSLVAIYLISSRQAGSEEFVICCQWFTPQKQGSWAYFQFPHVCSLHVLLSVRGLLLLRPSHRAEQREAKGMAWVSSKETCTKYSPSCQRPWSLSSSLTHTHTHEHTHAHMCLLLHCWPLRFWEGRRDFLFVSSQQSHSPEFNENFGRDLRNYTGICPLLIGLYKQEEV